jgi:hypothetical protein
MHGCIVIHRLTAKLALEVSEQSCKLLNRRALLDSKQALTDGKGFINIGELPSQFIHQNVQINLTMDGVGRMQPAVLLTILSPPS